MRTGRHVLALVALLGLALLLSERSAGFTSDEGSYAIQADAVDHGRWELGWPFRAADPEGAHLPYHAARVVAGDDPAEYAYVAHPAWPFALAVTRPLGGEQVGLRLWSMAAVVAAAACAAALARRLAGEGAAPWGFWLVATSPLLPDGLMLWAHAPSAAAAGAVALSAAAVAAGGARRWWWAGLAGSVAGGVLLRSEGLFVAAAAAAVLAAAGLLRRDRTRLAAGALAALAGAVALGGERLWAHAVAGGGGSTLASRSDGGSWLADRLDGAWTVLLKGADDPGPALLALLAAAAVALALVWARRERPPVRPELLLAASAALVAIRLVTGVDDPAPGLLAAWPAGVLALGGLALGGSAGPRRGLALGLGAGSLLVLGAVLATQYDDAGGLQWGGRYLSPLVVPLGALGAAAVVRLLPATGGLRRGLAALLAATAVLGLVVTDQVRSGNAEALARIDRTHEPVVLVAGDQVARHDWARWPDRCWIGAGGDLPGALEVLRTEGVARAAYVGFRPRELLAAGAAAATPDRHGSTVGTLEVGPGPVRSVATERAFAGCDRRVG